MAIANKSQLLSAFAGGQTVIIDKASVAGSSQLWNTTFAVATITPVGGTLAGTSTTQGVVPTSATAGFPAIRSIGSGNTAYLGGVDYMLALGGRMRLVDMLFKAGPYNFNDTGIALSSQPSFASRLPGGQYAGRTELWFEVVTAFTGSPVVTVTYTNQDGVAGQSTGSFTISGSPIVARMVQIPLANGDTGIQKIESVTCSGPSAGTFNMLVIRPLWNGRGINSGDFGARYKHGPDRTGLPIVYDTCALFVMVAGDSASTGNASISASIIEG